MITVVARIFPAGLFAIFALCAAAAGLTDASAGTTSAPAALAAASAPALRGLSPGAPKPPSPAAASPSGAAVVRYSEALVDLLPALMATTASAAAQTARRFVRFGVSAADALGVPSSPDETALMAVKMISPFIGPVNEFFLEPLFAPVNALRKSVAENDEVDSGDGDWFDAARRRRLLYSSDSVERSQQLRRSREAATGEPLRVITAAGGRAAKLPPAVTLDRAAVGAPAALRGSRLRNDAAWHDRSWTRGSRSWSGGSGTRPAATLDWGRSAHFSAPEWRGSGHWSGTRRAANSLTAASNLRHPTGAHGTRRIESVRAINGERVRLLDPVSLEDDEVVMSVDVMAPLFFPFIPESPMPPPEEFAPLLSSDVRATLAEGERVGGQIASVARSSAGVPSAGAATPAAPAVASPPAAAAAPPLPNPLRLKLETTTVKRYRLDAPPPADSPLGKMLAGTSSGPLLFARQASSDRVDGRGLASLLRR